jgi:hypothetical protein
MESFIIRLAVSVIPLVTLIAIATLADFLSRKRKALRIRQVRTRNERHHAFAVAAHFKGI